MSSENYTIDDSLDTAVEQPKGKTVGIDLGTTNSVVAYIDEAGQPQVIPSQEGPRTVPSVFAVGENGETHVGLAAVNQEGENAKNTVRSIKSKMGTSERITLGGREWSPEEISSEILKKLKRDAELYLGESVTSAVITVPAYFNSDQRQATKTAGQLAGLDVLRIISEPTAAALAYGLDKKKAETVLVYDLGGGTFDVTVLKITGGGIFDVQSTNGDTHLGGDDFDKKLMGRILRDAPFNYSDTSMQLVYSPFMTVKEGAPYVFIDEAMKARLREAAENCKKQLSASVSADVYLPYFAFADGKPINVRATITRDEFEEMIRPELDRTRQCIERALKDAKIEPTELSEVVFVGGSTRVPAIAARVEEWAGIKPNRRIHPDEAVAIGAAVQAGALTQGIDILVLDVTPLSLGIETQGGAMAVMVPRNTTIPTDDVTELFTTAEDNQESVDVKVYQGERPLVRNNAPIGNFRLSGITPAPRGTAEIEVTFRVDVDGIVNVSARDRATNRTHTVTIEGRSSLSEDDVRRMLEDAEANREADEKLRNLQKVHNALANQLLQVEALMRDCTDALTEEQVKDLRDLRGTLADAAQFDKIDVLGAIAQSADDTLKAMGRTLKARAQQRLDEANSEEK